MPTLYAYKITIINRERIIYNNAKPSRTSMNVSADIMFIQLSSCNLAGAFEGLVDV